MIHAIARVTALTGISMIVTNVLKPVINTMGGALETVGTTVKQGNNTIRRASEQAELNSQTKDIEFRMGIRERQRTALVEYGEAMEALKPRWDDIDPKRQDELLEWEKRLPIP